MVVREPEVLGNGGFEEGYGAGEVLTLGAGVEVESELAFCGCLVVLLLRHLLPKSVTVLYKAKTLNLNSKSSTRAINKYSNKI